jgi:hypothetical protein
MDVPLFDTYTGERIDQPQPVIPKPQRPIGEGPSTSGAPEVDFSSSTSVYLVDYRKIDRGILIETSPHNCLGWCCCAKQILTVDEEHVTLEHQCCGRSEIAVGWLDSITGYQLFSTTGCLEQCCEFDSPTIRISGINGIGPAGITAAMVVQLDNTEQIRQVLVALNMNREIAMQAKQRT